MKRNRQIRVGTRRTGTKQKLEMTLEELAMYLNELIDNSPVAILVLDPKHHVQMCNPAFERLFQYGREELMHANLEDLITTDDLTPEAVGIWKRVLRGRKGLRFHQAKKERRFYCRSGNLRDSSGDQAKADRRVRHLPRRFAA